MGRGALSVTAAATPKIKIAEIVYHRLMVKC